MNTIEIIKEFLGWCIVINLVLMIFSTIIVIAFSGPISRIQAKMFNLDEKYLSRAYFQYLAQYKIAIIVFNIVPYFALMIIN
jgi:hypothetical protein